MNNQHQLSEIPRYTYPILIKISAVACCIILGLFAYELPSILVVNKRYKSAEQAFKRKEYIRAFDEFYALNKELPGFDQIKLRLAQMLFLKKDIQSHLVAMNYLEGMRLDDSKWNDLICFMPEEYTDLFKTVEVKS